MCGGCKQGTIISLHEIEHHRSISVTHNFDELVQVFCPSCGNGIREKCNVLFDKSYVFDLNITEFIVFFLGYNNSISIEKVRTLVLTTAIMFELFFIYTCRSNKPLLKNGIFSNKWLNLAVLASLGLHLILLYTPLANLFGVVSLTLADWLFVLPFAVSGLIIFEIGKYIKTKKEI